MSTLSKKINSDNQMISWLAEFVERGEVKIIPRISGGLDIEVTYRSNFISDSDYNKLKNYLRRHGFTSNVGIHSRQKVSRAVLSKNFTVSYLYPESIIQNALKLMAKR
jgi:hypothetical protein